MGHRRWRGPPVGSASTRVDDGSRPSEIARIVSEIAPIVSEIARIVSEIAQIVSRAGGSHRRGWGPPGHPCRCSIDGVGEPSFMAFMPFISP